MLLTMLHEPCQRSELKARQVIALVAFDADAISIYVTVTIAMKNLPLYDILVPG
jgi:hypothetical protein